MRKWMMIIALVAVAAIISLSGCKPDRALTDDEKDRIRTRFQAYIDERGFSGAVYAVYRGEEIFDGGGGMATDTLKNGSDVAYGVASLSKQVTAAAVMRLYEQGMLNITDPLSKYFPDYRFGDKIQLIHLLSQRSGIPDYSVDSAEGVTDKAFITCYGNNNKYITVDIKDSAETNQKKIRDFVLSMDLLFEPGTAFDYSDANYALLAEIVSQVSGKRYHDYVRQEIFEPLGMKQSSFIDDYDKEKITKVAQTDRSEFGMDYYTVKGAEYGCGDVLTKPLDWYRWYRGLVGGEVVSKGAYELMTKNYSVREELGYGFGLMISDENKSKVVYHYGFIPSYYSAAIYIPEYDYFQVVFSNHAAGHPHVMAADMAKYFGSVIDLELVDIE